VGELLTLAHQVTGQAEQLEGLVIVHLAELLVGGRVADCCCEPMNRNR